jgi:1-acyl-sn-glycerol-3-phosphate acyltransferase
MTELRGRGQTPYSSSCIGTTGLFLRSLLFTTALIVVTPVYSTIVLAGFPLPRRARWRLISRWAHIIMWLARVILGLSYRVEGASSLPRRPAVILAKHQSAWETIAFQLIFPPHVHVLKRELLWIPFFGWALALMSPIAIDRSRGRQALKRIAELGAARLAQGFWIVIFPEGTRTRPGVRARYHSGGAWLAVKTGAAVVPVAHNAGLYWGRNAFLKRPGQISVLIGDPISPAGLTPEALNQKVEAWIESATERLCANA